ncbi:MAG: hypothetical protein QW568_01925 [Candidatus Anstonellaceae archaeon]
MPRLKTGTTEVNKEHAERTRTPPQKRDETAIMGAEHLLRTFASRHRFETPAKIFAEKKERRDQLLFDFVNGAVTQGYKESEIADALIKWRYPSKLQNYQDVSKDQAESTIVFASTSKVNWFELFTGGTPIVERGALLNGTFGRMTTNHTNITDTVAAALYIIGHDMEKSLPQPPWIMFGGRVTGEHDIAAEIRNVASERSNFESKLGALIVDKNWFKVDDPKHNGTVKFRLMCAIWDASEGRLYVVDNGGKTPFGQWVSKNLNDVLSSSDSELASMKKFIEQIGLVKKMKAPGKANNSYQPWSNLLKEIKEQMGLDDNAAYRQAVKMWRLATVMIHTENVEKYEKRWEKIKLVESILDTNLKLSCDDGRQAGDVKVLGAILTNEEFKKMFLDSNSKMAKLRFVPHYGCGFLSASHDIHMVMKTLMDNILAEKNDFERERMLNFFQIRQRMIVTDKHHNPVTSELALRDYLPRALAEEYSGFLSGTKSDNPDRRKLVETLHAVFAGHDKKLRSVLCRAVDTEILIGNDAGFIEMSAAKKVYGDLESYFGQDYQKEFTPSQIKSFVIEEVGRETAKRYEKWKEAMGGKFSIEFMMDNFVTGQSLVVPEAPRNGDDYKDISRADYYLTGPNRLFTPEEVASLGLNHRKTWNVA